MVSTRSVLSAGAAEDPAVTAGEVNSAGPTPRRSGRLRSSGGTAPSPAAPRSTRAVKTHRQLEAVEEGDEHQEQQQGAAEPEQQQEEQQEQQTSPRVRRRTVAAPKPTPRRRAAAASPAVQTSQPEEAAEEPAAAVQPAQAAEAQAQQAVAAAAEQRPQEASQAKTALVDVLAEQMFAALEELTAEGRQRDGSGDSSDDDSEAASDAEQGQAAAATRGGEGEAAEGSGSEGEGEDSGSDDSEDDEQGVPAHLRWQPELTLPGPPGAAAAGAAGAVAAGVHVVRRGKDGLHVAAPDERVRGKAARAERPSTAGKGWFDLPATQITDEVKNDLRMLRLRGALDPKAHYKKFDSTKFPKYFQMGTVVEGAADFYSGRMTNKQRKRTLTEEVMADQHLTEVRKKRFAKMQEERSRWSRKKGPVKKTGNERKNKPHHRPKH